MTQIGMHEAKTKLSQLVERAEGGEDIVIARRGKLNAPPEYLTLLLDAGVQPLPVTVDHAAATELLPPHHRDPFDRMLVAQATVEGAAVVSLDAALESYGVTMVW